MFNPANYPFFILGGSLAIFCVSTAIGCWLRKRRQNLDENGRDDFKFVLGGTLTLLGLLIGFTFSMAVERYNQRKDLEEQEANAIGTEYVRADLLPAAEAANLRSLLASYLAQRIDHYKSRDKDVLRQLDVESCELQTRMWSAVSSSATAQPTPITALAVAGMNDVLNSQGYTQAAWWNRVPFEAWALLTVIGICCNLMTGYGAQGRSRLLLLILPVVISVSLFLIADIDSPRGGLIRVRPRNLESLAQSVQMPIMPYGVGAGE
jgi:hypothetical protein